MSKCSHCGLDKNICRQLANVTTCQWEAIKNRNKEIRESRDEILKHIKLLVNTNYPGMWENAAFCISKAESLKDKK